MKSITLHPVSVLVGIVLASSFLILLGAAQTVDNIGHRGPVDVYYPPIPISSLEFFPQITVAEDATAQDVITVRAGERLALVGNQSQRGFALPVFWPLVNANGDSDYDYVPRSLTPSPLGMPTAILGPGDYVFATEPRVNPPATYSREPDVIFGYRVRG